MQKVILCIVSVVIVLSMSACSMIGNLINVSDSMQTQTEVYQYDDISLDLPVGFEPIQQYDRGINLQRVKEPDINEILTIAIIYDSSDPLSQESINKIILDKFSDTVDSVSEIRDFTEYEIDGYPAQTFKCDVTIEGVDVNYIYDLVYLDDRVFVVSGGTTNKDNFSELESIHNSIRVTPDA